MEIYDFGVRLKKLRKEKGMTQEFVANKIGVARNTISAYENNIKSPRVEVLTDLAVLYNSSLDYIVGISNRKSIALDDFNQTQQDILVEFIEKLKTQFIQ